MFSERRLAHQLRHSASSRALRRSPRLPAKPRHHRWTPGAALPRCGRNASGVCGDKGQHAGDDVADIVGITAGGTTEDDQHLGISGLEGAGHGTTCEGARTLITRAIFFHSDASLRVQGEHGLSATSPSTAATAVDYSAAANVLIFRPAQSSRKGCSAHWHSMRRGHCASSSLVGAICCRCSGDAPQRRPAPLSARPRAASAVAATDAGVAAALRGGGELRHCVGLQDCEADRSRPNTHI